MKLPKLETKYRFLIDPKLDLLQRPQGHQYTVQYRKWWSLRWKFLAVCHTAEQVNQVVQMHKNRVNYL